MARVPENRSANYVYRISSDSVFQSGQIQMAVRNILLFKRRATTGEVHDGQADRTIHQLYLAKTLENGKQSSKLKVISTWVTEFYRVWCEIPQNLDLNCAVAPNWQIELPNHTGKEKLVDALRLGIAKFNVWEALPGFRQRI